MSDLVSIRSSFDFDQNYSRPETAPDHMQTTARGALPPRGSELPESEDNATFDFHKSKYIKLRRWAVGLGIFAIFAITISATFAVIFSLRSRQYERILQERANSTSLSTTYYTINVTHTTTLPPAITTAAMTSTSTSTMNCTGASATPTSTLSPAELAEFCWNMLEHVCNDSWRIPQGEGFADCTRIYQKFYCGLYDQYQSLESPSQPPRARPCAPMQSLCATGKPVSKTKTPVGSTSVVVVTKMVDGTKKLTKTLPRNTAAIVSTTVHVTKESTTVKTIPATDLLPIPPMASSSAR